MPTAVIVLSDLQPGVAGVSCGCAALFGAAVKAGWQLVVDNAVPGTSGRPTLRTLTGRGHTVLNF